jgi:4-diphosphocytidyl-2-C-methyl-D-erythritol kinase
MMRFSINAPCKINLHLEIGKKRADGFHDLCGLFAALNFGDSLEFCPIPGKDEWKLTVTDGSGGPVTAIPSEKNLVTQAVRLFREETGFHDSLEARLVKRIPRQAGLGGGSSDAASTLRALNFITGFPLNGKALARLAARLGSDVPFFLAGGVALVRGRGEIVQPLPFPPDLPRLPVLLVKPPFGSDTAAAYRELDLARNKVPLSTEADAEPGATFSIEKCICVLSESPALWPFRNDFLPVFLDSGRGDAYRGIFATLKNEGALFTGLSGSGSACFGVYPDERSVREPVNRLIGEGNFAKITFFLAHIVDPVVK